MRAAAVPCCMGRTKLGLRHAAGCGAPRICLICSTQQEKLRGGAQTMIRGLGLITLAGVQLLFAMPGVAATSHASTVSHPVRLASAHHRARTVSDEPGLRSSSALVVDESDGSVLYSKHADVAAPIASITKLMTALVIAD